MLHSSKCWWLWKEPVMGWHWWLWKEPVVMCGNWNVRQATSQQLFILTTLCTDTRFQSFSPLIINCIVYHAVLKFSACCNKTLAQLVHIADWYSIGLHALLQHVPNAVIYRGLRSGLLAGHMSGLMNWGVSRRRSSTVSQARRAGALSCWKTNTSPAMLPIASTVGWVVQRYNISLWPACFRCPALDL